MSRSQDVVSKRLGLVSSRLGLVETWEGLGLDLVSNWKSNVSVSSRSRTIGSRLQARTDTECNKIPTGFAVSNYMYRHKTLLLLYSNVASNKFADRIAQYFVILT